jgi:hypothetical protein
MYKVVEKNSNTIIASSLTYQEARKVHRECLDKTGLNYEMTGLSVCCSYAVKVLRRYELEYLLDVHVAFFRHYAKWDSKQEAFRVPDDIYERLEKAFERFVIEQE